MANPAACSIKATGQSSWQQEYCLFCMIATRPKKAKAKKAKKPAGVMSVRDISSALQSGMLLTLCGHQKQRSIGTTPRPCVEFRHYYRLQQHPEMGVPAIHFVAAICGSVVDRQTK
jgi:hypothetical protein